MDTAPRPQYHLKYNSRDFLLYVFSLVAAVGVIWPACDHFVARAALACAAIYMAVFFARKHGAQLSADGLAELVKGIARYPEHLVRSWWSVRVRIVTAIALFALAVLVERALSAKVDGTIWSRPFPWSYVVWLPFAAISVFRIVSLVDHFRKAKQVREVLDGSVFIRTQIKNISTYQHIIHAFVTGILSHLCAIVPMVVFYAYTNPSYLREALLLGGCLLWYGIASAFKLYTPLANGGDGPPAKRLAYSRLTREVHWRDHESRFHFTVFHGHHHDAIPSGLMGASGGAGLLESSERLLMYLDFLGSVSLAQLSYTFYCVNDIFVHQYIPGVFPYSRWLVSLGVHHVAHHYGSLLPIGIICRPYVAKADYKDGYVNDNARIRWFLDQVAKYEGLAPERRQAFMEIDETYPGHEAT